MNSFLKKQIQSYPSVENLYSNSNYMLFLKQKDSDSSQVLLSCYKKSLENHSFSSLKRTCIPKKLFAILSNSTNNFLPFFTYEFGITPLMLIAARGKMQLLKDLLILNNKYNNIIIKAEKVNMGGDSALTLAKDNKHYQIQDLLYNYLTPKRAVLGACLNSCKITGHLPSDITNYIVEFI